MEYSQKVLELWRKPLNRHILQQPSVRVRDWNPLCGDIVEMQLEIEDDVVRNASFQGDSCAICTASTSWLTDISKGKHLSAIENITTEELLKSLDLQNLNPARMKCATLSLHVMKLAISAYKRAMNDG
jgi:nitrogen fixation protein NifU and related proteins